jgi:site-specific recombinase XerD
MGNRTSARFTRSERIRTTKLSAAYAEAYERYLIERGHARSYVQCCKDGVAHLQLWLRESRMPIERLDEALVAEFLDRHLRHCQCRVAARERSSLRAALGHLLVVLRSQGVIGPKALGVTPVDEELRRYDRYMSQARGLAPHTRKGALRIVGRLLSRFGHGRVDIGSISAERVRRFYAQQLKLYAKPATAAVVIAALRGYFRWRASLGDQVHALVGAISYPANRQYATLPKTLTPDEVDHLVASLGAHGPSLRRSDAMVRCALDLGLRCGEIARLGLDDIDWQAATITLRHTKGGHVDVMPLPASTGLAIAVYLERERPKTSHRMVFARHITPREELLGPDAVRKIIRLAFARAGLPYTRSHLLRHTMANRLLASGSSLKEVADVLRHRSLQTTTIYAKLDSRNLIEVALPWPGSAA